MDEFLNNNTEQNENGENITEQSIEPEAEAADTSAEAVPVESASEPEIAEPESAPDDEQSADSESFASPAPQDEYDSVYNPVRYSPITPIADYKPMSRGLKVFAFIMAAVVLLSAACVTGYFLGKGSSSIDFGGEVSVDLTSRPKDTDEMTPAEVYKEIADSIVGIYVYNDAGVAGQASGIVYSKDGYIVTNDHIYADIAMPKFKIFAYGGKQYDAVYVAGDTVSDLAVLKVDTKELTPAVFGNSDEIYHGQNVVAVGRPSDATTASSITNGIISSVSRRIKNTSNNYTSRLIETTSAINPGSSGGALVDMYGHVIGVTSSKLASGEYDNVGYAIPTTTVKRIAEELIAEGKVISRAKLGITYTEVDSIIADIYDYEYTGIRVGSVSDDSDLYGKLAEGDTITHINGIEVTSDDVVLDIIEHSRAGDKISVTFITAAGANKTVEAVLAANVSESSYTTQQSNSSGGSNGSGGGIFDFPNGE